jgi:hypothetical protein
MRVFQKPSKEWRDETSISSYKTRHTHFKKVGKLWSVRAGPHHRALAVEDGVDFIWVWIGPHDEYERLIKQQH